MPASLPVPCHPSAQRGVPLGMARWTSLWLMGKVSACYCAPWGSCLLFLSPTAVLAAPSKSSFIPGSQLKLLVGTSITEWHLPSFLVSICGSVYCLRRCQSGPSPSPLPSKAVSCDCCFKLLFINTASHVHKRTCIHAHTFCSLSQAGHNGRWENPPRRALIATGSAVQ